MKVVKSTLGALALGAFCMLIVLPTYATGSVYVDVPSLSFGHYDNNYNRHGYSKRYRHNNRYNDRSYRYDDYRGSHRGYKHQSYKQPKYKDRNYYGAPYQRSYRPTYAVCPDRVYSRYRADRRYCYPHRDHFHCD